MTAPNRRAQRPSRHALRIVVVAGALQVVCACGKVLGGRRFEDTTMLTLSDVLELVRLHSSELNATGSRP